MNLPVSLGHWISRVAGLLAWRLLSLILVLAAWSIAAALTTDSLGGPTSSIFAVKALFEASANDPSLSAHFGATATRTVVSLSLASAVGIPLGLVLGGFRYVYSASIGLVEYLRALPAFMLLPVFAVLGMTDEVARVLVISLAGMSIILDYVASGVRSLPISRLDIYRAMRINSTKVFLHTTLVPVMLQYYLPSLRICVGVCLIVTLVVEAILVPKVGLGAPLIVTMGSATIDAALGLIALAALLGWALNLVAGLVADLAWFVFLGDKVLR